MSEMKKLTALRTKLVARRRQLVEVEATISVDEVTGESITRIQEAIDAVDRALSDESSEAIRRRGL